MISPAPDIERQAPSDTLAVEEGGEGTFTGVGVAPGVAIGPAYLYTRATVSVEKQTIPGSDVQSEVKRFETAIRRAERDLKKIIAVTREKLGTDSADIFEAQQLMLRDEGVYDAVRKEIHHQQHSADYAVKAVMDEHRRRIEASGNAYMEERAQDLVDVQERIIRHLRRRKLLSAIDPSTIVVAESLTAADVILFSRRDILGCVMDHGGPTSHVAIMARALGVPAVVGMHDASSAVQSGDQLILDGHRGQLIVDPTDEQTEAYRERKQRLEQWKKDQRRLVSLPAETSDGQRLTLHANVECRQELDQLDEQGAEGIGLFRTEVMLLNRGEGLSLSEEEAYRTYRRLVEEVTPSPTTFRLLDLGGDKMLPLAHREHNPFLGWRGIRLLLDRPELLNAQLRAILRAGAHGPARLLLPMVTLYGEVEAFFDALNRAREELQEEGYSFDADMPVGMMVEVPSVALQAERFADLVDFFSIGTNDLTQYVLAVDRGNDLVSEQFSEFHPSVLALIGRTVAAARTKDISVSLCGEMAADPRATSLLVGLGIDTLSASPIYLPEIKRVIRAISFQDAEELVAEVLQLKDAAAVCSAVDEWLGIHAPDVADYLDGRE